MKFRRYRWKTIHKKNQPYRLRLYFKSGAGHRITLDGRAIEEYRLRKIQEFEKESKGGLLRLLSHSSRGRRTKEFKRAMWDFSPELKGLEEIDIKI